MESRTDRQVTPAHFRADPDICSQNHEPNRVGGSGPQTQVGNPESEKIVAIWRYGDDGRLVEVELPNFGPVEADSHLTLKSLLRVVGFRCVCSSTREEVHGS